MQFSYQKQYLQSSVFFQFWSSNNSQYTLTAQHPHNISSNKLCTIPWWSHDTHMTSSSPTCLAVLWWVPWSRWSLGWSESVWTLQTAWPPPDSWTHQSSPWHRTWPDQWRCDPWTWCPGPRVTGELTMQNIAVWENGTCVGTYTQTTQVVVLYIWTVATGRHALHLTVKLHS